jgi:hypothetical protein
MKIHYTYEGSGCEFEDSYQVETRWDPEDLEYIAEECADDYHSNHDGWEDSWPVTFLLWDNQGRELGTFEVYRDTEPVFRAHQKDKQAVK